MQTESVCKNPPTPFCHASSLCEVNGELIVVWFGGSYEGCSDVGIWLSRKENGMWSHPHLVATAEDPLKRSSCYNPVLFLDSKGVLYLFYKVGTEPSLWHGRVKKSIDFGKSWTDSHDLPEGIFGPVKNKPVELKDGTILCASSAELGGWKVHFERFQPDEGAEGIWWKTTDCNDPSEIGAIQPSLLIHKNGMLQAIGRTQNERMFTIESRDEGKSWGPMRLLPVENPNSGTDALTLKDGRFLLVYNPSTQARTPLSVAVSTDGLHWERRIDLETDKGQFSYPAVIQGVDGAIHLSYTWQTTHIRYVKLLPDEIY